jgi:hypothetical protein
MQRAACKVLHGTWEQGGLTPVWLRFCQGLPGASLQWGAWGGTGMAVAHNLLPRIVKSGLGVLQPAVGVAALASVLAAACSGVPAAQLVVSPFQWPKLMAGADRVFPVRDPCLLVWLSLLGFSTPPHELA